MGVKDLWQLSGPVEERISLHALRCGLAILTTFPLGFNALTLIISSITSLAYTLLQREHLGN